MARDLTVSIDAMGGDAGPGIVVAALVRSVVRHPAVNFILHGDEAELKPLLAKRGKLAERVAIRHTAERVRMEEKPSLALRRGRNTSMWRAIESVKKKEAEVAVSAGNTGALMAMSMVQLGTLEGIARPAIAALWPTKRGQSVVLDVGANMSVDRRATRRFRGDGRSLRPRHTGTGTSHGRHSQCRFGRREGQRAVKGAAHILRNNSSLPIEFAGFVEGDDIAEGTVDVVVTDGFTGNVALKTAEGTAKLVTHFLRSALRRSFLGRLGAILCRRRAEHAAPQARSARARMAACFSGSTASW